MRKMVPSLLTVLAAVLLPRLVTAAEDAKSPEQPRPQMRRGGPDPEMLFKRLDANGDGVITADEIPAGMPDRLKQPLLEELKKHDGKLTLDAFSEVIKQHLQRPGAGMGGRGQGFGFRGGRGGAPDAGPGMPGPDGMPGQGQGPGFRGGRGWNPQGGPGGFGPEMGGFGGGFGRGQGGFGGAFGPGQGSGVGPGGFGPGMGGMAAGGAFGPGQGSGFAAGGAWGSEGGNRFRGSGQQFFGGYFAGPPAPWNAQAGFGPFGPGWGRGFAMGGGWNAGSRPLPPAARIGWGIGPWGDLSQFAGRPVPPWAEPHFGFAARGPWHPGIGPYGGMDRFGGRFAGYHRGGYGRGNGGFAAHGRSGHAGQGGWGYAGHGNWGHGGHTQWGHHGKWAHARPGKQGHHGKWGHARHGKWGHGKAGHGKWGHGKAGHHGQRGHARHGQLGKAGHQKDGRGAKAAKTKTEKAELKGPVREKRAEAALATLDRQMAELKDLEQSVQARLTALQKRQDEVRAALQAAKTPEKKPEAKKQD